MVNYTTTVKADKTLGEIQSMLSKFGATKIMLDYEAGNISILSFQVIHGGTPISFRLPANIRGVHKALNKKNIAGKFKTEAHAYNVAWRIIKDWIAAQLALIESEQADMATIMLPYAITDDGSTVSERVLSTKQMLLTA